MEPHEEALAMLQSIVEMLVDNPTQAKIEGTVTDTGTDFRVSVHPDDTGKLIGKQGRTARALRIILGAAAMAHKTRFSLDIVEAEPRQCVHCGCTDAKACVLTNPANGLKYPCSWTTFARPTCSNPKCWKAEVEHVTGRVITHDYVEESVELFQRTADALTGQQLAAWAEN